jgi:hypothetical protein
MQPLDGGHHLKYADQPAELHCHPQDARSYKYSAQKKFCAVLFFQKNCIWAGIFSASAICWLRMTIIRPHCASEIIKPRTSPFAGILDLSRRTCVSTRSAVPHDRHIRQRYGTVLAAIHVRDMKLIKLNADFQAVA